MRGVLLEFDWTLPFRSRFSIFLSDSLSPRHWDFGGAGIWAGLPNGSADWNCYSSGPDNHSMSIAVWNCLSGWL